MKDISRKIADEVCKHIPLKTKRTVLESKGQVDLITEFKWNEEEIKKDMRNVHEYFVFTWSNSNLTVIEGKGINLLEKISKNHTIENMPTHVALVDCVKSFKYKLNADSTFGEGAGQSECQKINIYTLTKVQIEKIAEKILSLETTKSKKKTSSNN